MNNTLPKVLEFVDLAKVPVRPDEFSPEERAALEAVNQKVAAGLSLRAIVDFLFESTKDIFPCDRVGLAFIEDHGQRAVSNYTRAAYQPLFLDSGYAEDLAHSSLAAVLKTRRPRIIHDLKEYLRRKPRSPSSALLVQEGVASSLTCPLIVDARSVGFLFRSSRSPRAYTRHHVLLHQAVAERLSQAVEKAYRIEQLTAANKAYFEMLGFVSHELKSPLSTIAVTCDLFLQGYLGKLEPVQQEKISSMYRQAHYLLDLVGEYLNLARIESGALELRPAEVDFAAEVADRAAALVAFDIDQKRMRLDRELPEAPLLMECDPALLQIALANLLGNAVKYGLEGGQIRLKADRSASVFMASVWNEGPGFPKSERSRLFRKFSRLQTPELLKQKGTGVGLYTVWQIVQLHGGRVWADSEPGRWAEFALEIPQPLPKPSEEHLLERIEYDKPDSMVLGYDHSPDSGGRA